MTTSPTHISSHYPLNSSQPVHPLHPAHPQTALLALSHQPPSDSPPTDTATFTTTIPEIDNYLLSNGLSPSLVTAISSDDHAGGALIAREAVISALLARRDLIVAVVDTRGGAQGSRLGDVRALKQGLVRRIRESYGSGRERSMGRVGGKHGGGREKETVDQRAEETAVGKVQDCLERVKVMRVFDLEGVMEAVGEVREGLESGSAPDGGTGEGGEEDRDETDHQKTEARGEVGDSQEESEDDGDAEMDMHADVTRGVGGRGLGDGVLHEESAARTGDGSLGPKVGMVVIDNITNVTSAMMNSFGQSEGLAVLHTLLHSLALLTRHHHLVTIILNGVVPARATSLYYANAPHRDDVVVSPAFASTNVRPALGKGFLGAVDVHLLLGRVPRTKRDAESAYAGEDEDDGDGDGELDDEKGERGHDGDRGRRGKAKTWEEVGICEVLTDREGDRAGRWAPFNIVDGRVVKIV